VKKVLVIDDHVLFREGLISLFRSTSGFEVVEGAGSVHEGIEKARLHHPDIILMDFSLPDGTGLDATEVILTEMPECKIVFLTVYEADEKLFAAIRAGAKGYIPKNIAGSDLISSLHALERGELAISRKLTGHIIEEFSHSAPQTAQNVELLSKLSPREMQVLAEMQKGLSNREIAERLFISENTVKHHIRNILSKLEVENRHEASQLARQAGTRGKG
jgi:DNA-binding NarL/FixJ family response regulator